MHIDFSTPWAGGRSFGSNARITPLAVFPVKLVYSTTLVSVLMQKLFAQHYWTNVWGAKL
jgi:hypothetical protein